MGRVGFYSMNNKMYRNTKVRVNKANYEYISNSYEYFDDVV